MHQEKLQDHEVESAIDRVGHAPFDEIAGLAALFDHPGEQIARGERLRRGTQKLAKSSKTDLSTGGMITKLQAAKRCVSSGIAVVITSGKNPEVFEEILSGNFKGTLFLPADKKINVRKKWIGYVSHPKGFLVIDEGAKNALLKKNKSLLPSGILEVHGEFKSNDTISVKSINNLEIARGVSGFSSDDLKKIKGRNTIEIERILGHKLRDEVIHKDNLVLIEEE